MTDWRENTGTVPPEVGPDTVVEVEYRNGDKRFWDDGDFPEHNTPDLWIVDGYEFDIIRWRIPA